MTLDLGKIGKITRLLFDDKKLYLTLELNGLKGVPIDIVCDTFRIASDGSFLEFADIKANMPFAQNALDRFLPPKIAIPPAGRPALILIKGLLNV